MGHCIYLLSPAKCSGKRASYLLNPDATFELARRLHGGGGITLGEAFSFMSGLYFRGKLAYATRFGDPPAGWGGAMVITPDRGLVAAETVITAKDLRRMAAVPVDATDARYRRPLVRTVRELADALIDGVATPGHAAGSIDAAGGGGSSGGSSGGDSGGDSGGGTVVLLGSIATGKYLDLLRGPLGDRLRFPAEFVGRGDMSRGGLMLRCVRQSQRLTYVALGSVPRHGKRPAKLPPHHSPRKVGRSEGRPGLGSDAAA